MCEIHHREEFHDVRCLHVNIANSNKQAVYKHSSDSSHVGIKIVIERGGERRVSERAAGHQVGRQLLPLVL